MIGLFFFLLVLTYGNPAYAYFGLGAALPALGSAIAFVFLIFSSLVGLILYPVKKYFDLRSRIKKGKIKENTDDPNV